MMDRRDFLKGMAAIVCAPYVCRNSGLLMPIADRSLAAYSVIGHDVYGNRMSETIVVTMQRAKAIRSANRLTGRYGELVEPIFQEAFKRGNLVDYSPVAVGPIFPRGRQCVERGDEFTGMNGVFSWIRSQKI